MNNHSTIHILIIDDETPILNMLKQQLANHGYDVDTANSGGEGIPMAFTGEFIAITTVLCWTISIQFFEAASKRVGPTPVNIIRLTCALMFFGSFLFFRHGYILPVDFPTHAWVYLSLSGIIGFFLGDIFLFKALVEIGPRITMLIFSLSAPATAIIGWIFLKETYVLHQWLGILVTITGVALVVLERNQKVSNHSNLKTRNISFKGIVYAIGAMLGQALGYILSKIGMQTNSGYLDAFSSTQIRAIAAFICFLIFFSITGRWKSVTAAINDKKALLFTTLGSAIGPFLGVSLSLHVLHYLTTGVASAFLSLVPVFIIPFSIFLHKEHVSIRAAGGAVIAVSGIYLLML